MINTIQDYAKQLWKSRGGKDTTKKWVSGNAVCCIHNGETIDRRRRGGALFNADGSVSWHCFNCNFKASFQPGRHLNYKFRKLLEWMGGEPNDIKRLVIDAIRLRDTLGPPEGDTTHEEVKVEFKPIPLPLDATSFSSIRAFSDINENPILPTSLYRKLAYIEDRKIDTDDYEFYVSDDPTHKLDKRVLIPCYWQNKLIGYTGRGINPTVIPKYFNQYGPNYVFNVNKQKPDWQFVVVCEGPFDAMSVDGVAVLTNEVSETQAEIIEQLTREVVVVPDGDHSGNKIIDSALKYGWSVSFPVWLETCNDINEATEKYGKLFTLLAIAKGRESNPLKIALLRRKLT